MPMTDHPGLVIIFYGGARTWNPLHGLEDYFPARDSGKSAVLLRSLPGNLVAWGSSWNAAASMLRDRIDNAGARHPDGLLGWYRANWAKLNAGDKAILADTLVSDEPPSVSYRGSFVSVDIPRTRKGVDEAAGARC